MMNNFSSIMVTLKKIKIKRLTYCKKNQLINSASKKSLWFFTSFFSICLVNNSYAFLDISSMGCLINGTLNGKRLMASVSSKHIT